MYSYCSLHLLYLHVITIPLKYPVPTFCLFRLMIFGRIWVVMETQAFSVPILPLAHNQFKPVGSPVYAMHGDQELRSYDDCHDLPWPGEEPWDEARQRELIHGYYASVSYTDAQVGRLLDELDRLGIRKNTIVVLWGDHGWKLGEHNGWCKQTNYEIDTRVPMIFSGYGVEAKAEKSRALTEFVDIYPTLCEMADLPIPGHMQGSSLVPLLSDPDKPWKKAAFSQFLLGRFGPPETREQEPMGYAIRTDQYRYVEWYTWNKELKKPEVLLSSELFDQNSDPDENMNLASDSFYEQIKDTLSLQLRQGWYAWYWRKPAKLLLRPNSLVEQKASISLMLTLCARSTSENIPKNL